MNFNSRDNSFDLYGFESPEELNFFKLLTSVSGIGPKYGQAILSSLDVPTLQLAIINGDANYLKKISGIGPKTAERIILELKTKVMATDLGDLKDRDLGSEGEAIDALVALGYSQYQARDAIKAVSKKARTSEEKIKEALRMLGARR